MIRARILNSVTGTLVAGFSFAVLQLRADVPLVTSAVSNGWAIQKYVSNDRGTVILAGGGPPGFADGIVYSSPSYFFRLASPGYEPPGVPGSLFVGFPVGDNGDLALNQNDYVVFTASYVACSNGPDLASCLRASPLVYGLFAYYNLHLSNLVLGGDPVPGKPGYVFTSFDRIWLNDSGDFVFRGWISAQGQSAELKAGLFLYSGGQVQTIAIERDPAPGGLKFGLRSQSLQLSFNNDGLIVFFEPFTDPAVFRYAKGNFSLILAPGDPAPGGGTILYIIEGACTLRGDVVLNASFGMQPSQQGLFLLRSDGSKVRILADGDPTPAGGSFSLWFDSVDRFGDLQPTPVFLSPVLNNSGSVLFAAPLKGIPAAGGLFAYDGSRIRKIVMEGEPRPDDPAKQFSFASYENGGQPFIEIQYALDNSGIAVFNPGHDGLFYASNGRLAAIETAGDLTPNIVGKSYAFLDFQSFLLSESGRVAFQSSLCCGTYVEGIFVARPRSPDVTNGSFEAIGSHGLPARWTTTWTNFGSAEANQFMGAGSAAFDGSAILRLHTKPGGGSVFALSDPAQTLPDTTYLIQSHLRFYFSSDSDEAYFSVLQFDAAGRLVGFDEIRGLRGDSYWSWIPMGLLFHTAPNAAFLRYRFGLVSNQEMYLDIDAVH